MFRAQVLVKKKNFRQGLLICFPRKLEMGWQKLGSHVTNCRDIITSANILWSSMWQKSLHLVPHAINCCDWHIFCILIVLSGRTKFQFLVSCYKRGAHAQYPIRWSLSRLGLRASRGPAISVNAVCHFRVQSCYDEITSFAFATVRAWSCYPLNWAQWQSWSVICKALD